MNRIEEDTWITRKAAEEDGAFIAAGHIGFPAMENVATASTDTLAARVSFSRFVELARLSLSTSPLRFCTKWAENC